MKKFLCLLCVLLFTAACSNPWGDTSIDRDPVDVSSWRRVEAGDYAYKLPPDWVEETQSFSFPVPHEVLSVKNTYRAIISGGVVPDDYFIDGVINAGKYADNYALFRVEIYPETVANGWEDFFTKVYPDTVSAWREVTTDRDDGVNQVMVDEQSGLMTGFGRVYFRHDGSYYAFSFLQDGAQPQDTPEYYTAFINAFEF